jgi:hypothetical protein
MMAALEEEYCKTFLPRPDGGIAFKLIARPVWPHWIQSKTHAKQHHMIASNAATLHEIHSRLRLARERLLH